MMIEPHATRTRAATALFSTATEYASVDHTVHLGMPRDGPRVQNGQPWKLGSPW